MHMIDILVQPAIFMSLFYTLTLPEIKFVDYYIGRHVMRCLVSLLYLAHLVMLGIMTVSALLCCSGTFTHMSKADYITFS